MGPIKGARGRSWRLWGRSWGPWGRSSAQDLEPDLASYQKIFFEIRPGLDPARLPHRQPPSMHPHPPTLTHLHMSTRLTLIHPDCHLLGKKEVILIFSDFRIMQPSARLQPALLASQGGVDRVLILVLRSFRSEKDCIRY